MSEKLAPLDIPVPAIVMRGSHGDLDYAIFRRVPGLELDELSANEFELRMFDNTFLDKRYFDDILPCMTDRLQFCPEERYLEHADFGFGSVLSHEEEITAVLDRKEARHGDFPFDMTWLDLGMPEMVFLSRFRDYYTSTERDVLDFGERIA